MRFSLTQKLVESALVREGLVSSPEQGWLKAFEVEPRSLGDFEASLDGPISDGLYQKLSELLTKLPNLFEGQIVLFRSMEDSEVPGLRTKLLFFETVQKEESYSHLQSLLSELKLKPHSLTSETWTDFQATIFGNCVKEGSLPDLIWEKEFVKTPEHAVRVLSLTELPQLTWKACFQAVFENPSPFALSIKFSVPDRKRIKRQLETKRRVSHALSVQSSLEVRNIESNSVLHSSEETLERILVNKETLFEISVAVILSGPEVLTLQTARNLERLVSGIGNAGLYLEGIGSLPVLKSHQPGSKTLGIRKLPILSENLAEILPLTLDYSRANVPSALHLRSRNLEISHLNFFSKENINYNAFICGASGSGKSFLMNAIIKSLLKDDPRSRIGIFDIGGSYRKLVQDLGGRTEKLDSKRARALVATFLRKTPVHSDGIFRALIEILCGSGSHITHSHSVAIEELLSEFVGQILRIETLIENAKARPERYYQEIAHWLKPHKSLDSLTDMSDLESIFDTQVTAFDFKGLEKDPILQKTTIFLLSELLWRDLETGRYSRTMIGFDEVWKFFAENRDFVESFYRTVRKYYGGIISITQNIEDYGDDSFAKMIYSTSETKIVLQSGASEDYLRNKLNTSESDIARALSVRSQKPYFSEFFARSSSMSQVFRLYPTKEFYELANTENVSQGENIE